MLARPGHIAILGAAGSGKTTLLKIIATLLASVDAAALDTDLATVLPEPRPLPVLLPLRVFEHACNEPNPAYQRTDLLDFLDPWFRQWGDLPDLPPNFLRDHVIHGRAWLLLDALDEVADRDHRMTMRNVINRRLVARCPQTTRIIVTARVAAYRDAALDNRFRHYTVTPLTDEQRGAMVRRLYRELRLPNAAARARDLAHTLNTRPDLQTLNATPVMVWTAAVIHAFRGTLPEGRAALYDAYVQIVMGKLFDEMDFDVKALSPLTGALLPVKDRILALSYGAFRTHERGKQVIAEEELVSEVLTPYFGARRWSMAPRDFVDIMLERSGILMEADGGLRFGSHLSMQEFLAGRYLARHLRSQYPEDYQSLIEGHYADTWWHEALLFGAGLLGNQEGDDGADFLAYVAQQGQSPDERLAALELAGTGCAQLIALGLDARPGWFEHVREDLTTQLHDALFDHPLDATLKARHQAGLALGRLWGYPTAIDDPSRDPRFPGPLGVPEFVRIPAGQFIMGRDDTDEKDERPAHPVHLDEYAIAKYPVTNAMFRRFLDDGGYANADWWAEAVADGRWQAGVLRDYSGERTEPAFWTDQRWNNPAQPVVGVTWYEAIAYCRWLTAKLREADDGLSPGEEIRLPTEAEWEKAAAYDPVADHSRRYPWADEWEEGRANTKEAGLEQTTIAGLLAGGGSALRAMDMVGNVWEWCGDWYGEDYYRSSPGDNPRGPDKGSYRVLRGGSWYHDREVSRCGFRFGNFPVDWDNDRGIRLARASSA